MKKLFSYLNRILSPEAYLYYLPWMALYVSLSALYLGAVFFFLRRAGATVLYMLGRAAVTDRELLILFTSWQGWVFFALSLILVYFSFGMILNGMILLSSRMLCGGNINIPGAFAGGLKSAALFLRRGGWPAVLYFVIACPVLANTVLFRISTSFELSGFILYLISKKLIYRILYDLFVAVLVLAGLRNLLLIHCTVLENGDPSGAAERMRLLLKGRRIKFYTRVGFFLLSSIAVIALVRAGYTRLPDLMRSMPDFLPRPISRFLMLFYIYALYALSAFLILLLFPIQTLELTRLYYCFRLEKEIYPDVKAKPAGRNSLRRILQILLPALLIAGALLSTIFFDRLFPGARDVEIVVHRLCGNLDAENTIEGLEKAYSEGARSFETDVQRTKDGYYIIFHDGTFLRLCGINKRPSELTLKQIRALRIKNAEGQARMIPTLAEVLTKIRTSGSRLYIELKGITADEKMADDVIRMVRKRNMEDRCTLISMRYDTISYIYKNNPDIRTGLLYFFAYGKESLLDADALAVQANAVSPGLTISAHAQGKKILGWTANTRMRAHRLFKTDVDGIITDRYDIVSALQNYMNTRSDYARVMDALQ